VIKGQTLTIAGGQVLTVGGSSGGVTIASPPIGSRRVGGVVLGNGPGALSFEILGFSVAAGNSNARGSGSGGGAGKVSTHEITITKTVDSASPKLSLYCANGKHFAKVTIVLRKAGGSKFVQYTLSDVLISSYELGTSTKGNRVETVTLNFGELKIER